MTVIDFLRDAMREQHRRLDASVRDLTPEQLHWLPDGSALNHIGFTIWHYVRTEDNIVQFVLQERTPPVWLARGFQERFGLERVAQGTGMSTEDAHALRLPAIDEWLEYQRAVWEATDAYLSTLEEASLEREVRIVPFGEITVLRALSNVVLAHGHGHFGEICVLRVLQGLPSGLN